MKDFIKGMDISFIPQYEDQGRNFADEEGNVMDPLELAGKYGVNYIRLRIWNQPELVPESGGYCSLEQTLRMARRIRAAGMGFMLDFHYSDFWADPANQRRPRAWEGLSVSETAQALYQYTKAVLSRMSREGVLPDMVQIGNEIRCGMLFPEGDTGHWDNLSLFINAGIRAVREIDRKIKVVLHLDQGGRIYYLKEWFDQALAHGVTDFDLIALSYYPFWHGDYAQLKEAMETLYAAYGKPLLIAEAAHAWRITEHGFIGRLQEKIAGFPLTPSGQEKVLRLIMNITANISDGAGLGVFYWEPLSFADDRDGGWGKNMSVLDDSGRAHQGIRAFLYRPGETDPKAVARIYEREKLLVPVGSAPVFPETVRALHWDGTTGEYGVSWQTENWDYQKEGSYWRRGICQAADEQGKDLETAIEVEVYDPKRKTVNLIPNGSFAQGMEGWKIEYLSGEEAAEIREELTDPFPMPPKPVLYIQSREKLICRVNRTVPVSEAGDYILRVNAVGDNTTGVNVSLRAMIGERKEQTEVFLQSSVWMDYELSLRGLPRGELTIELYIDVPPMVLKVREISLIKGYTKRQI